jgi:hypothetical protein
MRRPKDLHINEAGDLELGHNGDLACSYDDDVTVEGIIFRLKTYTGNYRLEPECGAGLEDFIGQPNAPELGDAVVQRVVYALTHDSFVNPDALTVDVAPLSPQELIIITTVKSSRSSFTVLSSLDLLTGRLNIQTE